MEIIEPLLTAALIKVHSLQLIQSEGYIEDASACFVKRHRVMQRNRDVFLDYDNANTIEARIERARKRSELLRCEAADIDTVLPMLIKDKHRTYAVMMVLQHRFIKHHWHEYMDIFHPHEQVKGLIFEPMRTWVPGVRYINTAETVYHDSSPIASLLALITAYTQDYHIKTAPNHYSPAYAKHIMQLVRYPYAEKDVLLLARLAYQAIPHTGNHYEGSLAKVIEACIRSPEHKRFIEFLDTLLTCSLNLCAQPKAATALLNHAERYDVYQRKRAVMTVCLITATLAVLAMAIAGVMGRLFIVKVGINIGAVGVSTLSLTYLWKRSEFRPPPITTALKDLSMAIARHGKRADVLAARDFHRL